MYSNSDAIKIFCSRLCAGENTAPLETREWGDLCSLMIDKGLQPFELLDFSERNFNNVLGLSENYAQRLIKLADRRGKLFAEIEKLENNGVTVLTRADKEFPENLKKNLGNMCPPVLYCMGDISLLSGKYAGFTGSRRAEEKDEAFTRLMVRKTAANGYGVVSGGARGVDAFAEDEGVKIGCGVLEFPSEGILRRLRSEKVFCAVQDGALLLLSAALPYAPFNSAYAIMRNRYIYAQSSGTVVVRSDLGKGGTWAGATDNLKHGFCAEFCRSVAEYAGNAALIKRGAIPIDEAFQGNLEDYAAVSADNQLSMF
ncbi:MAG: DNA-processing protein DprA [Clostridia bacterium]|nr:DNA-processing protein DprA [Clostridia bacterium]